MRRWSPYNYAFNNPIRFIDPDGKESIETEAAKLKEKPSIRGSEGGLASESGEGNDDGEVFRYNYIDANGSYNSVRYYNDFTSNNQSSNWALWLSAGAFGGPEIQKVDIRNYQLVWKGQPYKSQIDSYLINFAITELENIDEETFAIYMGNGKIRGKVGGNAFINDQGRIANLHPAWRKNFTTIDEDAVKLIFRKNANGGNEFISLERVNRTFNLSNSNIELLRNQIQRYDLKHNTVFDRFNRLNREYGSPIEPIPLRKFKQRN